MILRPYQQAAVDAVYEHLRSKDNNPCVVLPTGTGKSLVIAQIVRDAVAQWNGRVLILAHVKELLEQNAGKIRALCPELKIGIFSAGLKSRDTFSEYRFVEVSNSMTFRPPQIHSLFFPASDFEKNSKFSKPNHFYVVSNRVEVKRIFRF